MAGTGARMLVQMMMVGFNIVTKAAMQAYQQAKAGGGGAAAGAMRSAAAMGGSRMAADEARAILALESAGKVDATALAAQFNKYYTANDPANGGSFYIQSKIWNAKEVLTEEARRAAAAASSAGAAGGAGRTGGGGGRMA